MMKPFRDVVRRLDDGSGMSREVHVRFCEGLGLQCPGLLTQRMREFLDHNGRTPRAINRSPSRPNLDELVVRVETQAADQRAAEVESRRLTQFLETPRTELRLEHMQPIAAIANVVL